MLPEIQGFPDGSVIKKESYCQARDAGSMLGSGRSPGEGNGNQLQFLPGKSHGQFLPGKSPLWATMGSLKNQT